MSKTRRRATKKTPGPVHPGEAGVSADNVVARSLDEKSSGSALLVLGMHRSGTSAMAGALGLCGAWVGEETELTGKNVENPLGFWERRDMRELCDGILHSAGADWWKIAGFDPDAIPQEILAGHRRKFEEIVTALDEHGTWVVKEPRLCLVLPVLRDYIKNPVCIHIFRNPLEVAYSLQRRNGFSIAAGLALWETYNLRALSASGNLPRVSVSHESLMLHPVETLNALVDRLEELAVTHLAKPDGGIIKRFIDPSLYRQRVTDEETEDYLLPSQRALWLRLRSSEVFKHEGDASVPQVTRRHLLDLESIEFSLARYQDTIKDREKTLREREKTLRERDRRVSGLEGRVSVREETLRARDKTIRERDKTIRERDRKVSDLEGRVSAREETIRERDKTLRERDRRVSDLEGRVSAREETIRERDKTIRARDRKVSDLEGRVSTREKTLRAREKTIKKLLTSTSWKITAPLRGIKLGAGWFLRKLRHGLRLLSWLLTGQFSRVVEAVRFPRAKSGAKPVSRPEEREATATDRLSELIHERGKGRRIARAAGPASSGERPVVGEARTKVTVIAWDLGHNPLGRAYLLADVLRHDYDVELIGAQFPRFGNEVWEPLRNCSRVTIKSFPGGNFPQHFKHMEDIAEQVEGDLIYVSKPRLPSLELAILAKLCRNRPVILDMDDYEPGFFNNRGSLTLDVVKTKRHKFDFSWPHDETWTRYGESLIPLFEQVTVSNEELQKKFGGMILPHIRDEHDFDPTAYPRDAIRAELGFTPEDKVILFAGTPRMHKGFDRIVAALESLNRPDYKLLVAGSPVDNESRRFFKNVNPERVKAVSNTPFCDLPGYLCAGDLICLLQDEDKVTSHFQMPAKFTDGLSMGIPMLATGVPPLVNLAKEGLVELLGDAPPERKIDEIFSDYEAYKHKAMQNREVFLREYSYGANLPRLRDTISRLLRDPAPIPDAFHELVACHREMFSGATDLPRVTAKVVAMPAPVPQPATPRPLQARSYIDDKMDIVFFWKQNDTGIYGRRQDMLLKYLAKDPRIHRILHFDAPVKVFKSGHDVLKSGQGGRHSHSRLVFYQTLRRRLRLKDKDKVRFDTFIFGTQRRAPGFMKRILPSEKDYLDYLARALKRHQVGQRRTVFWVCPNNFDFPSIEDRFKPDLVVADVIDDQRKWPYSLLYKKKLGQNYEEILARCHLVFANCRSVFEAMGEFTDNIHLLPNAAEILEEEAQHWKKPAELARIKGPVIGYAGNLDITRLDLDLLMTIASQRPDWNLVFIGSMHRSKDILKLNKFKNVYFLGVRPYDQALHYIRYFDVAMIPHLDNELTQYMNPLKLYVYFSLHVPVVTTPIANIENFGEFVEVGRTPEEFIKRISYCLDNDTVSGNVERIRELLKANSWDERVTRLLTLIGEEFTRLDQRRRSSGSALPTYDRDSMTKTAEALFWDGNLPNALKLWQELLSEFADDEALSGKAKLMISVINRLSDLAQYRNQIESYAELTANKRHATKGEIRVVIFTAISDNYDTIKLPERLNHDFDYILFTNLPTPDTKIWQIRPMLYLHSDKTRSARFIKTHPHLLLEGYDIAVWIDSNITILDGLDDMIKKFLSSGKAVGAIPHPLRESIYEEITVCEERRKDEFDVMREQIAKYEGEGFSHHDLIESNLMIFDLRHEKITHFLDTWWREIDNHSKRDQLSLNYSLAKAGLEWQRLANRPDSMRNEPGFTFVPHDKGVGPNAKLIEALQAVTVEPYAGPSYARVKESRVRANGTRRVDIIVCVHNALDYVRDCLEAVSKTRSDAQHRLIIVDDGSGEATEEYLKHFASQTPHCELHRNNIAQGYTRAANRGLVASTGEFVILLNSDTVVTNDWTEKLADAVFSTPGAGIVGPLSNAASYQSIPEYQGASGQTAVNMLPSGLAPEVMNSYCEQWTVADILPLVPLVHGFCFGVTRKVIEKIGYFDEENFPKGYGEENDYCFRATDAGFSLVVATHTYVFHAKSKSYTEEKRLPLARTASETFKRKYDRSRIKRAERSMAENPILAILRARAKNIYDSPT